MQHIQNFSHNKYFCIEYKVYEGCKKSNCIKTAEKTEYLSPSINITEEIWKSYNIEYYLDALFSNISSYCTNYQWKKGISDKTFSPRYFKYFIDINPPYFLFFSFEGNLNDIFEKNLNAISEGAQDLLIFNKLKENIIYIKKMLVQTFNFCDFKYDLHGLICQEYAGHYSAILINLPYDSFLLEKGKSYYYNEE